MQELGLTKSQAAAYTVLVKNSPCPPPKLANLINESRTNTYKLLEQLEELGLVARDATTNKICYWANSPSALRTIAEKKKLAAETTAKKLEAHMHSMLNEFAMYSLQPAVQFNYGQDGIVKVFEDYTVTGQDLYLVRSWKDRDFMGKGVLSVWRKKPSTKGITTHILAPDTESASSGETDKQYLIDKTWMQEQDYTAPVEWCAYGDKLAIISYGNEAISMVIQSKQIADAFKQLFCFVSKRQKDSAGYAAMPQKSRLSDDPAVMDTDEYKKVVHDREVYIKAHPSASSTGE